MTYELTLAPTVESVGVGRRLVAEALSEWGLDDITHTAMLLTSEVLTNSLLHARTQIVLTVERAGTRAVTISVRDGSPLIPRRRRHAQDATTGRGLELLDRLSHSWHVEPVEGGKTLTFTITADVDPWGAFDASSWLDASP
ncbi:MAG: phosphoserine phosphatase RsbU/P [Actinomycetota bacterium]|jgi:anti-sigma regulatory factor (Ser/Thr protein kinase)|nr:phosphoserine phosphatase RsbU/P [Actinomycetota bacterium]